MRPALPVLVLLLTLASVAACGPQADGVAGSGDKPAPIASKDAVLDSMLARFETAMGRASGFTVQAGGVVAVFSALPDTGMVLAPPSLTPGNLSNLNPNAPEMLYTYMPNVRRIAWGMRQGEMNGPIDRNGSSVYILSTDDPEHVLGLPKSEATNESKSLSVFVDAETFAVREIQQSMRVDSLERPISMRYVYSDFRPIDGVSLPFSVRQIKEGVDQLVTSMMRMVEGGQLTMALNQAKQAAPSPERDRQIADLERQMRAMQEGVDEMELIVDSIRLATSANQPPNSP